MDIPTFIQLYREAFGTQAPLPLVFAYSDTPVAATDKTNGCLFKALQQARHGQPVSLHAGNIGCGGGKFYTGFAEMAPHIPAFVSTKEKYKQTPQMVVDFLHEADVRRTAKACLNLARIDQTPTLDNAEGLLFFATPDVLSGLCTWAFFDNNSPDTVCTLFGSGCATAITYAVNENRRHGRRTFLGLFDPSVRPYVGAHELGFAIPLGRFKEMYATLPHCCLFGTHAWEKVRSRIDRP